MASKAAMEPGKNLSINKPMEEGKQNSPYSNKDQKFKDNEEKKLNAGNNNQGQETKFNSAALISPQSTKSSLTDSNSNQSSISNSNNNTPQQHQNINRSFIKNSKLTTQSNNTSRYNYTNNNQQKTSSRPEQKDKIPLPPGVIEYDNELVLQNLIRAQIEYLFSDYHLTNDTYLLARMQDNQQNWLSIDELCHNQKVRCLTTTRKRILKALKDSPYLEVSSDDERVRRPTFTLPKLKPNRDLRRTVFLYGIPYNKTEQDIRKILSLHGHIKRIHFQPDHDIDPDDHDANIDDEAPNKEVAQLIMKKKFLFPSRYAHSDHDTDNESNRGGFRNDGNNTPKSLDGNQSDNGSSKRDRMMNDLYAHPVRNPNGDAQDFSHLKTCFVVFESQSQATKCVKARVRAVDGMRCIHKYDYNKVAKKYRTAQMKGEKLSFSPPPPNYQSPRISSQGERGYNHHNRGKSPGAQSDHRYSNNQYGNNRRYNRSFGPNSRDNNYNDNRRDNRGYQSYRDRSHSQSSQGSNHGDRGDRNNNNRYDNNNDRNNNNYRQGRYYQRNNNNNNQNRSQTPNYQKSGNYGGQGFLSRNNKRDNGDDKENQGSMRQSGHRLGRRADRNSHDNSNDKPNDVRSYHDNRRKYSNNHQSQPGYNNNNNRGNNNNRHGASTSPHRTSQHSAAHSVGNQSNTSDQSNTNKPILYSMNKQNNNNNNVNGNNNNNNAPQQDVRKVQNNNQQTQQQQQQNVANQPTYARKKQPVRAATPNMKSNGSIVSPPQLHSFVGNEISPSPDLKKPQNANNNQQQQQQQQQPPPGTSKPAKMIRSVSANTAPTSSNNQQSGQQRASTPQSSQQSRPTAAPQLYHPIGTNALPTRQDAQALQAAGYNHELYYLPIDDPNIAGIMDDIYQDPLVAYDVYFGVDQSGQSTSTQVAAQQLQQQQQRVHQQQQQRQQQQSQQQQQQQQAPPQQQVQQRHSQPQHTAYSSHYNVQQNVQNVQQQPQNYGNYQQQYSQTPTHHQQQQQYHQSYNMNQGPPQTNLQHSSSLQHNSYSAHSQYQQQSNGPRSAPYGPVNKQSQTQSAGHQYRAEQWQLDKLEQFKQQKQQQIIAQKQAQQQQQAQQQGGKTTALSVLSSSTN